MTSDRDHDFLSPDLKWRHVGEYTDACTVPNGVLVCRKEFGGRVMAMAFVPGLRVIEYGARDSRNPRGYQAYLAPTHGISGSPYRNPAHE